MKLERSTQGLFLIYFYLNNKQAERKVRDNHQSRQVCPKNINSTHSKEEQIDKLFTE